MRGADLRRPRRDLLARRAEETAAMIERAYENGAARREAVIEAFDLINQGTRKFFEHEHLNSSVFIRLQDAMRIAFAMLEKERGILPHDPTDPDWGRAGREPILHDETQELRDYRAGKVPRPFFWFGKGENSE